jgi:hypothetical protein
MQAEEKSSRSVLIFTTTAAENGAATQKRRRRNTRPYHTHTHTRERHSSPEQLSRRLRMPRARFTTTIYAPFISAAFILTAAHKFDGQLLKLAPRAHTKAMTSPMRSDEHCLQTPGGFLQAVVTKTLRL